MERWAGREEWRREQSSRRTKTRASWAGKRLGGPALVSEH
jgi:hypothetical protein